MNAHFQNGIAECCIRDLQERTRTSMLYAMNKWKKMVIINLWPYAMRHANDVANATPRKGQELSPLELFSGIQIAPKLRHFHAFRCPTYMLDNALQSEQGAPKWKEHSRLGVYLGPSPNHARSIALVLNPRTGHVSPQFHVKFNNFFETVQAKAIDLDAPDPEWKYLSGFATKRGTPKSVTRGGLDGLLAPQRGAIATASPQQESTENAQPVGHQQDLPGLWLLMWMNIIKRLLSNPLYQRQLFPCSSRKRRQQRPVKQGVAGSLRIPPATIKACPFATKGLWHGNSLSTRMNRKTSPQQQRNLPRKGH